MKGRLFAAVFCLLAALFMSVGSEKYIVKKSDELIGLIDSALNAPEDSDEMYSAALASCDGWDGCEMLFGSLLKHTDADELDHNYSLIREYVKSRNTDELIETLEECKIAVKVIADGEKLRAENIF